MTVQYRSTRSCDTKLYTFKEIVIAGLCPDGGLFVPESVPQLSDADRLAHLQGVMEKDGYCGVAYHIIRDYIPTDECCDLDLHRIINKAYSSFQTDNVIEIKRVLIKEDDVQGKTNSTSELRESDGETTRSVVFLELFHGPTFAFKDVALQLLGGFLDFFYDDSVDQRPFVVLGATSGDTGGAAMAGIRSSRNVKGVIMYPLGGTSDVQESQMISLSNDNVKAVAVDDACFDDCQTIVKKMFIQNNNKYRLIAVNSINWCRILAQMVYYWYLAIHYRINGKKKPDIVVPTGNFGNILAGWYAKRMGAPIGRLIIASNANDILTRIYESGKYLLSPVKKTYSPSMDIVISSNFERFIYYLVHNDGQACSTMFDSLKDNGYFDITEEGHTSLCSEFSARRSSDTDTLAMMALFKGTYNYSICPHTAVGVACAMEEFRNNDKMREIVVVATADAAKFPEAWNKANIADELLVVPKSLQEAVGSSGSRIIIGNTIEDVTGFLDGFIYT